MDSKNTVPIKMKTPPIPYNYMPPLPTNTETYARTPPIPYNYMPPLPTNTETYARTPPVINKNQSTNYVGYYDTKKQFFDYNNDNYDK